MFIGGLDNDPAVGLKVLNGFGLRERKLHRLAIDLETANEDIVVVGVTQCIEAVVTPSATRQVAVLPVVSRVSDQQTSLGMHRDSGLIV